MHPYDAIVILGGGVRDGGALPPWAARRYDLALLRRTSEPMLCLSAGTFHRGLPSDEHGLPIFESVAGARYLTSHGVLPDQVLIEAVSWDTIGNAYYSRLLFADPFRWKKLLVITSQFHMPRSRAIFEWVYGMEPAGFSLAFEAASDDDMSPAVRKARTEREQASLASFRTGVEKQIRTLNELHPWIYTGHRAYNASGRSGAERERRSDVLESY